MFTVWGQTLYFEMAYHPADIKAKCQGGEAFAHTRGQSWSSSKCFHADEIFLSGLFFPYQVKMYLSLFLDSRSQT